MGKYKNIDIEMRQRLKEIVERENRALNLLPYYTDKGLVKKSQEQKIANFLDELEIILAPFGIKRRKNG